MLSRPHVVAGEACRTDVLYRKLVVEAEYFCLEPPFFFGPYLWIPSSSIFSPRLSIDIWSFNLQSPS
jgi:hypothetical protein